MTPQHVRYNYYGKGIYKPIDSVETLFSPDALHAALILRTIGGEARTGDISAKTVTSTALSKLLVAPPPPGAARPLSSFPDIPLPDRSRSSQPLSLGDLDLAEESPCIAPEMSCGSGGRDCDGEGATRRGGTS